MGRFMPMRCQNSEGSEDEIVPSLDVYYCLTIRQEDHFSDEIICPNGPDSNGIPGGPLIENGKHEGWMEEQIQEVGKVARVSFLVN